MSMIYMYIVQLEIQIKKYHNYFFIKQIPCIQCKFVLETYFFISVVLVKIKLVNLISSLLFFNKKNVVTRCMRNRGSVEVILLYLSF
jgi:hypothetical protein